MGKSDSGRVCHDFSRLNHNLPQHFCMEVCRALGLQVSGCREFGLSFQSSGSFRVLEGFTRRVSVYFFS